MIPNDCVHVNFHYVLGPAAAPEEANWGFYLQYVDDRPVPGVIPQDWAPAMEALAGDMADSHAVLWDSIKSEFPLDVQAHSVRVAHLDNTKHELHAATAALDLTRGEASPPLPYQCSPVVTLYGYDPAAFAANRARKRGRFYLPPLHGGTMAANGVIGNSTVTTLSTAFDAFFEDVQGKRAFYGSDPAVDYGYYRVVVVSNVGAGLATQVEVISIGNVMDTQRRRRRSLNEVRTNTALSSA